MKTITTIPDYCKEVNISQPKYPFFDIRKFEDKVATENAKQPPFRHKFYAIALRHTGGNIHVNGHPLQANLFFNTPFQIISWDVLPDWKGWYIMFGHDFLAMEPGWGNFLMNYPFFRLDKIAPFSVPTDDVMMAELCFAQIYEEYHSDKKDKFLFIQTYTQLLLLLAKRHFNNANFTDSELDNPKTAHILLVSQFQSLLEITIRSGGGGPDIRQPSFYAKRLHIHPNHLNAVVKRVTGKTATFMIHNQLIMAAKSLLSHTSFSIKETSFRLHFKKPAHFNFFFKKATGLTPLQYRKRHPIL